MTLGTAATMQECTLQCQSPRSICTSHYVRWSVLALVLLITLGCDYGPKRTIPQPRTSVDDDEVPVAAPAIAAAATPSTPTATPLASAQSPQTQAATITNPAPATAPATNNPAVTVTVAAPTTPPPPLSPAGESSTNRTHFAPATILPTDLAHWRLSDYQAAVRDNSPRLQDALDLLGRTPDDEANILVEMLKTPSQASLEASDAANLARSIVDALASNSSAPAQAAMEKIANAEITTSFDDRIITEATLAALAKNYTAVSDRVFTSFLTNPQRRRSHANKQLTPDELQELSLQIVAPVASPSLRACVAEYISSPSTSKAHRRRLLSLVEGSDVSYLPGETVLYRAAIVNEETKSRLEKKFAAYSKEAASSLMATSSTSFDREIDRKRFRRIARDLWNAPLAAIIEQRIANARDPAAQHSAMLLAANVPVSTVRTSLLRMLQQRSASDLLTTVSPQLITDECRDPGLLILAKLLNRNSQEQNVTTGRAVDVRNKADSVRFWHATKEALVLSLKKQCYSLTQPNTASDAPPTTAVANDENQEAEQTTPTSNNTTSTPSPADIVDADIDAPDVSLSSSATSAATPVMDLSAFPFTLHSGGHPLASYRLILPDDARTELSGTAVGELQIHYAKAAVQGDPRKVLPHYERVARTHDRHLLPGGGVWLDALHKNGSDSTIRSLDVVIAPMESNPAQYSVEVLTIEMPDPSQSIFATTPTSTTPVSMVNE